MQVTIGRIVLYELSDADATQINRRRTSGGEIAARTRKNSDNSTHWPIGAQAHIGKPVQGGDIFPMIVTRVESPTISGQVFLDGNDCFWAQGVSEGRGPTCWSWPPKV